MYFLNFLVIFATVLNVSEISLKFLELLAWLLNYMVGR